MKGLIYCLLTIMTSNILLSAQELPFRITERSPFYSYRSYGYVGDLELDEIVYARNIGGYNPLSGSNDLSTFKILIIKENENYATYAKNLVPLDTNTLFGSDVAIAYDYIIANGITLHLPNEMWVPSYYCDVLRSKERETLTIFEPHLVKYNTGDTGEYGIPMQWHLHSFTHIRSGMYMFYNSRIYAGDGSNF
ncbi:MAG: hypothetical protein LBL44_03385, partial [Treponema sp.]|nr:hypothetical protein [Treponema sp.]